MFLMNITQYSKIFTVKRVSLKASACSGSFDSSFSPLKWMIVLSFSNLFSSIFNAMRPTEITN